MKIDIETIITQTLLKREEVIAILLYGSQAKGTAQKESDIDIAVLFRRDAQPTSMELIDLREEISDKTKKNVDLVCLNNASPIIGMQVVKNGKLLHIASQTDYDRYIAQLVTDYSDLKIMRKPMEDEILKRRFYG